MVIAWKSCPLSSQSKHGTICSHIIRIINPWISVRFLLFYIPLPRSQVIYRKTPKISPWAYIFQSSFWRGLFLEGPIFGGAYVQREICVSKSIGLACSGKEIYHFCFVLLCIRGQIPSTSSPWGLYSEGWFNGGFLALGFWGAYIWRGVYMEGLIFGILRYTFSQG